MYSCNRWSQGATLIHCSYVLKKTLFWKSLIFLPCPSPSKLLSLWCAICWWAWPSSVAGHSGRRSWHPGRQWPSEPHSLPYPAPPERKPESARLSPPVAQVLHSVSPDPRRSTRWQRTSDQFTLKISIAYSSHTLYSSPYQHSLDENARGPSTLTISNGFWGGRQ